MAEARVEYTCMMKMTKLLFSNKKFTMYIMKATLLQLGVYLEVLARQAIHRIRHRSGCSFWTRGHTNFQATL